MVAISPSMSGFLVGSLNLMTSWAQTGAPAAATRIAVVRNFLMAFILSMSSPRLQAIPFRRVLDAGSGADPSIFPKQPVQEAIKAIQLFEDAQQFEVGPKGFADFCPREKMVIVISVDEPVPRALLAGIMAELHREDRQQQVAPRLQDPGDAPAIPGPVAPQEMVEAPVIQNQVEGTVGEVQMEGIPVHKARPETGLAD